MYSLYVVSGPDLGRSFELRGETTHIGKSIENEIQIKDRFIAQRHLTVVKRGGMYFLKDLGSDNGTFVDGNLIRSGVEVELREGVPVVIGMSVFCVGERCSDDILDIVKSLSIPTDEKRGGGPERTQHRPRAAEKNMRLLREVSRFLTQSLDLGEVLERILDSILKLLKRIDRGAIILLDPVGGGISKVVFKAREGIEGDAYCREVVDQVIGKGSELMIMGKDQALSEELKSAGIKSLMCVPLLNRGKVSGAIYVDSVIDSNGFRKDDLSFFKALSIPAAHAIHNALLYSGAGRRGIKVEQ
ncbi:MAG: FHA domain-containing protein [Desulfobacteraceae bacterium]|nr:MAG: FHA domain-containing protein [Desulfobacteraceae bacterium]